MANKQRKRVGVHCTTLDYVKDAGASTWKVRENGFHPDHECTVCSQTTCMYNVNT